MQPSVTKQIHIQGTNSCQYTITIILCSFPWLADNCCFVGVVGTYRENNFCALAVLVVHVMLVVLHNSSKHMAAS